MVLWIESFWSYNMLRCCLVCCKMLVVHCVDVCHCMSYVCADQCSFTVAGVGSGDSGAV